MAQTPQKMGSWAMAQTPEKGVPEPWLKLNFVLHIFTCFNLESFLLQIGWILYIKVGKNAPDESSYDI